MKDRKIEFVSYDGEYPNLCSGMLTLKINGEVKTFYYDRKKADYPDFWYSGGTCWVDGAEEDVTQADWEFDWEAEHDCFSSSEKRQIEKLFQKNVPHGCCGGCI